MKKKLCMPLIAALLLSLLSGCGGEPKAEVPMGRYVELSGPVLEGIENVDDLHRTADGDLVFYGGSLSGGNTVYYRCVMPAGSENVERTEAAWLNDFLDVTGVHRMLRNISEGPDGTVYFLYNELDLETSMINGPLLARSVNGGAPELLSVAELEKKGDDSLGGLEFNSSIGGSFPFGGGTDDDKASGEEGQDTPDTSGDGAGISFGNMELIPGDSVDVSVSNSGTFTFGGSAERLDCSGVVAMEDGFLLLFGDNGLYRYNTDGIKTVELPGQAFFSEGVRVHNATLLVSTADGFATYDMETLRESGSYSYDSPDFYAHMGMDDHGIYLADSSGIYRQTVGGGILERLVDASMTSLVMPNQSIVSIVSDGEDGFWAILLNADDEYRLVHYDYDPDMPTNPDTELTIFSLRDNATVRQTIGEFQRLNPNVRVNFRVATADNPSATTEDLIRALNTEILNGNGPDFLLLDGLPVESYMEKGVLADLSDLLTELDGTLLSNLMKVYTQDGKVYGIPAKFTVPVMMGDTESLKGLDSLEELAQRTAQGGEPPFLRTPGSIWGDNGLLEEYYNLHARSFLKDDALDQEALAKYWETVLTLDTTVKAYTPQSGNDIAYTVFATMGGRGGFEDLDMGSSDLRAGKAKVHVGTLSGLNTLTQTIGNLTYMGGQAIESAFHSSSYIPVATMGVLSTGSQQELAKEFLKLMLSSTVQDSYVYDGFAVNAASLEKLISHFLDESPFGTSAADGDMGFFDLCKTLDTPVLVDQVVKEAAQSQIKALLEGSVTPQQAAANVADQIKLYLAE